MLRIVTDSVASFPDSVKQERHIDIVSLYVNHNGQEFVDAEMDVDAFYAGIADMVNNIPTSSQPSQHAFEQIFEGAAEAGEDVLGIFISQQMSGTFESAVRVAKDCKKKYPDFSCVLIDSSTNGSDEAFVVMDALDVRDAGGGLAECAEAAIAAIRRSRFLFSPETMAFLQAGGRIGKATALLGGLLKIVPILTVSDGEAKQFATVRTRKKALERMEEQLEKDAAEHGLKRVIAHYIGSSEPAKIWAREVIEPFVGHEVPVLPVSPVIGVHVGPAIGMAYECNGPLEGKYSGDINELVFSI